MTNWRDYFRMSEWARDEMNEAPIQRNGITLWKLYEVITPEMEARDAVVAISIDHNVARLGETLEQRASMVNSSNVEYYRHLQEVVEVREEISPDWSVIYLLLLQMQIDVQYNKRKRKKRVSRAQRKAS